MMSTFYFDFFYKAKLTPIHIAAEEGTLHICASLLQAGANPNLKDIKGIFFYIFYIFIFLFLCFFNFYFIGVHLIMLFEK